MGQVLVFSLTSAANPTLIAAVTVMLLLPHPERLMRGFFLGAMAMGMTVGLVIVFALKNASVVHTAKHTANPIADVVLAAIFLVIALVLGTGRDKRVEERRAHRKGPKQDKGPPRWQRALDKGDPRITFVVGALLSLPGASYLAALDGIIKLKPGTVSAILLVLLSNVIGLVLLEVPMVSFAVAPDWTPAAIDRAKRWFARNWRMIAVIGTALIGLLLAIRGVIEFLS
jgi:Sap, sulfolipid-1-addressing protein